MTFFEGYTSNSAFFFSIKNFNPHLTLVVETMQDMKFTILWAEETLIEANLIFDILFLTFYDNFTPCTLDQWKSQRSIPPTQHQCATEMRGMGRDSLIPDRPNCAYYQC
jgi:hypothetical protein